METYSTKEAAEMIGVHRVTLQQWLTASKIRPSQTIQMDSRRYWRWTEGDVKRGKNYKEKFYRKGRGRKPKANN
jgi:predicted site-specific integrase-resolvase